MTTTLWRETVITHIERHKLELTQRLPDEHYLDAAWSLSDTVASTGDGAIEIGYWEFEGDQRIPPQDESFEELFVFIEGTGVFSVDGQIVRVEAGDSLLVSGPTGEQRMWSTGLTAVYIQRRRDIADGPQVTL